MDAGRVDNATIEIACMYCGTIGELNTFTVTHEHYYKLTRKFHCDHCGYRDNLVQKVNYGRNKKEV